MRVIAASVVICVIASQSYGQLPANTTVAWATHAQPAQHTSPTFALKNGDNTKSNLSLAKLTVEFPNNTTHVISKATLIIKVSGGPGIWNPGLTVAAPNVSIQQDATNMRLFTLAASDFNNPLTDFAVATDIRIEWDIEFSVPATKAQPNPPTLTATVGSKTQKPTPP